MGQNKEYTKQGEEKLLLPTHWVYPIFYDEYHGLSEEEIQRIRDWKAYHQGYYPVDVIEDSVGFYEKNDALGIIGCDCIEVIFNIYKTV